MTGTLRRVSLLESTTFINPLMYVCPFRCFRRSLPSWRDGCDAGSWVERERVLFPFFVFAFDLHMMDDADDVDRHVFLYIYNFLLFRCRSRSHENAPISLKMDQLALLYSSPCYIYKKILEVFHKKLAMNKGNKKNTILSSELSKQKN